MVVLSWWTSFLNTDFLQHLARRGFVTVVPGLSHALNALAVCCQFLRFQLPLLVFVAYPLTVSLSYLFFCCCERRFLGTRPQATPAETARDAALSPAI
jgi:hypothetical protein